VGHPRAEHHEYHGQEMDGVVIVLRKLVKIGETEEMKRKELDYLLRIKVIMFDIYM
jgi:hypothetical protein